MPVVIVRTYIAKYPRVPGAKRHPRMAFLGKYASINPAEEIGFLESNLTEARFVNSGKVHVAYRSYIYGSVQHCGYNTGSVMYRSVTRVGNRCVIIRYCIQTVFSYSDVEYRYGTDILYTSVTDV